ncbi:hypothetical protein SRHO_G00248330 [Serrasalmus rhombeus]
MPQAHGKKDTEAEGSADPRSTTKKAMAAASEQQAVLQAINALKVDLLAKIDEKASAQAAELRDQIGKLQAELGNALEQVKTRVEATETRMVELEASVSGHSDFIVSVEKDMLTLRKELATLKDRCEDLEARSRRSNLRIMGMKEGREGGKKLTQFVANLLKDVLNLETPPLLDRAHRSLRKAHDNSCGDRIRVLPDFTLTVSRRRAAFNEIRSLLRGCEGVRYGLMYPATLRITTSEGTEVRFEDPEKARAFIRSNMASSTQMPLADVPGSSRDIQSVVEH